MIIFDCAKNDIICIRIHHFEFVLEFCFESPSGCTVFFWESQALFLGFKTLIFESGKTLFISCLKFITGMIGVSKTM